MKDIIALLLLLLLLLPGFAGAEIYAEIGIESGGDTLASTNDFDLNVGGGFKLAAGTQNSFGFDEESVVSLSLGYLFDELDASNGSGDFNTVTFDAIYSRMRDRHRFGAGLTYHIGPEFSDNVAGFSSRNIKFDDALGFIFQYSYEVSHQILITARLSEIDYEANGRSFDAGSFGVFVTNGF